MGILGWKFSFFFFNPLLLLHFVTDEKVDRFCHQKMIWARDPIWIMSKETCRIVDVVSGMNVLCAG